MSMMKFDTVVLGAGIVGVCVAVHLQKRGQRVALVVQAAELTRPRWSDIPQERGIVVTLTTHPALSLPCGVDQAGMPFGLQIVGPFHGDRKTLAVAHALEQVFDQSPVLRRPRPDLSKLTQADPSLKSIVTAPPLFNESGPNGAGISTV